MDAAVLRRALIRERFVETDIVRAYAVDAVGHANKQRKRAQIANDGTDRDIDNIIAEPPPVRPASRDKSSVLERILDLALEHIRRCAENAQTGEAGSSGFVEELGPLPANRTPASKGPP